MGALENSMNRQEVTMSTTTESIKAERTAVRARVRRRQRLVIGLDHTYTALFYGSGLVVFITVTTAILSGTAQNLWGVAFGVFALPHLFDDQLTDRIFGRAFNRDSGLLLALDFADLETHR